MRKKRSNTVKSMAISALLTGGIYFCSTSISAFLLPHTVSGYILYAGEDKTAAVKKSGGVPSAIGRLLYLVFGVDFFGHGPVESVSGNIIYDTETPTVIDIGETPSEETPEQSTESTDEVSKASKAPEKTASVIERNINSSGGRTKIDAKISLNNETAYSADGALPDGKPAFTVSKNAKVLIYHTHTTESYQPDESHDFLHTSPDRTTDTAYNMVAVGESLVKEFEKLGVECVHIKDLYDYPKYNDAYARSCRGVAEVLAKNPDIKIVLDLHRDAITTKEGQKTKITADINGEKVAQVMLVVGTDELGLAHDNWRTNLKFAFDLQSRLIEISPSFVRPVNLRTSRFNGHVAPGAVIIEVGAAGNTLSEAKAATPHIAQAVSAVIKTYSQ